MWNQKCDLERQLEHEEVDPELRGQRESELTVTKKLVELLDSDLRMLRQFIACNSVVDAAGLRYEARMEPTFAGEGGRENVKRPVVRIAVEGEEYDTIFTRVDPANAGTSIIIRVRAGWSELKAELTSPVDGQAGSPLRWDTYVCTAAEQPYALEVRNTQLPFGRIGGWQCAMQS